MSMPSVEELQQRQMQAAEKDERRTMILDQILESNSKERLNRIRLVKPDLVRGVEESLIAAATNGKLKGKVSEEQLIGFLEQLSGSDADIAKSSKPKKVTIQRRKYDFDDDDDDDSDLM